MPKCSKREYEQKLEQVRLAMLRGFTDREIITAEQLPLAVEAIGKRDDPHRISRYNEVGLIKAIPCRR